MLHDQTDGIALKPRTILILGSEPQPYAKLITNSNLSISVKKVILEQQQPKTYLLWQLEHMYSIKQNLNKVFLAES